MDTILQTSGYYYSKLILMRTRRLKISGTDATYHCMTRTVNRDRLFQDREKEVLRKILWQVADFCGVELLTYCIMSNHFHVLVRVPCLTEVSDQELLRRYKALYPKPTKYQTASISVMEKELLAGGEEAETIRKRLLSRMGDISEFMKAVKQRFSVWYNKSHGRCGTLWGERFKSVLVEGEGNALQTMAAYIDLNPVRAGLVEDPKDYRFCGYAEAVATAGKARIGIENIWSDHRGCPMQAHRELIFGKRAADTTVNDISRDRALKMLEKSDAVLPRATLLRCRVRYFTDGAILGSKEYVRSFADVWQRNTNRIRTPKAQPLRGADWQGLVVIKGLRKEVFG